MISIEKWMILRPLQKLPNNVGDLDKIIVATGFEWLPKVQKNRPIWSHNVAYQASLPDPKLLFSWHT